MKTYFRNAEGEFITAAEFFKNSHNFTIGLIDRFQDAAGRLAEIEKNFNARKTEIALYVLGALRVEFDDCLEYEYFALRPQENGVVEVQSRTIFGNGAPKGRKEQFTAIMGEIERLIEIQRSYAARATASFVEVP